MRSIIVLFLIVGLLLLRGLGSRGLVRELILFRLFGKRRQSGGGDIIVVVVHRELDLISSPRVALALVRGICCAVVVYLDNERAIIERNATGDESLYHIVWDLLFAEIFKEGGHRGIVQEAAFLAIEAEMTVVEMYGKRRWLAGKLAQVIFPVAHVWLWLIHLALFRCGFVAVHDGRALGGYRRPGGVATGAEGLRRTSDGGSGHGERGASGRP